MDLSRFYFVTTELNSDRREERRSDWEERQGGGRERGKEGEEKRGVKERPREDSVSSEEGGKKSKQGRFRLCTIFTLL